MARLLGTMKWREWPNFDYDSTYATVYTYFVRLLISIYIYIYCVILLYSFSCAHAVLSGEPTYSIWAEFINERGDEHVGTNAYSTGWCFDGSGWKEDVSWRIVWMFWNGDNGDAHVWGIFANGRFQEFDPFPATNRHFFVCPTGTCHGTFSFRQPFKGGPFLWLSHVVSKAQDFSWDTLTHS